LQFRLYVILLFHIPGIPGLNPGPFTLDGTNTYLVGTGKHRLLIDTGQGIDEYAESLLAALKSTGTKSIDILLTHKHLDHVGGIDQIRRLMADHFNLFDVKVFKNQMSDGSLGTYLPIIDNQIFEVDGATLKAICTPGHTTDHTSFLLLETNTLFSGDCILGKGSTVFESLVDYMKSLEKLQSLAPVAIYPGHGPMVDDAMKKIKEYIYHRNEREKEIVSVISESPKEVELIVSEIYKDYPLSVQKAALNSTILHLEKLLLEGDVVFKDGKYYMS
jgi:glyoxylase-like metal-dependent hydrolase (beta-lactamase superfamily II)